MSENFPVTVRNGLNNFRHKFPFGMKPEIANQENVSSVLETVQSAAQQRMALGQLRRLAA